MTELKSELGTETQQLDDLNDLRRLGRALHDLCQPLTTLQCRLEMAGIIGTNEAYREAVELGLAECSRLIDSVESLRGIVRSAVERVESTTA